MQIHRKNRLLFLQISPKNFVAKCGIELMKWYINQLRFYVGSKSVNNSGHSSFNTLYVYILLPWSVLFSFSPRKG